LIAIRWGEGPGDLAAALALREEVFVREQGVPVEEEVDGRDDEALHLLAFEDGSLIGTLRLLFDGSTVKVGRVAVARRSRRRGVAAAMLEEALAESSRRGCTRARLASQVDAVAVYEGAGFAVESGVFEEAGIPHVWMGRTLGAVA
jgi:ElaA protein